MKTIINTAIVLSLFTFSANAATVLVTPESVNRIISPANGAAFGNIHYSDLFATHGNGQKVFVQTTNTQFVAALSAALGPLSGGQSYQINSATMTIGAVGDAYVSTGAKGAYVLTADWNPATVTWNSSDTGTPWSTPGLAAGTHYNATAADTGVVSGSTTVWSGLGSTVQSWLDGTPTNNKGLFFADTGALNANEQTNVANVKWSLDAEVVPEPSSTALLGLGGLALILRRRK